MSSRENEGRFQPGSGHRRTKAAGLIYEFAAWSGAVKFSVSDITREILADRRRDADSETCRQQPASTILTAASP
jgi:hypothetical protein